MNTLLINLSTAVEWQCAYIAAGETWWHDEAETHTFEFEGPDGEEITLQTLREGNTVTVEKIDQ